MKNLDVRVGSVAAVMALLCASASAQMSFTKIADSKSAPGFDFFSGKPAINNNGQVAFVVTNGVTFQNGVYRGNGGPITPIALSTTPGVGFISPPPSINDNDVVAFQTFQPDNSGAIRKGAGGALTPIHSIPAPFALSSDARVSINNAGLVAFGLETPTGWGIFAGNGGPVSTIVHSDNSVFSYVGELQMNAAGVVGFYGQLDAGGSGIFSSATGAIPTANPVNDSIVSFNDAGVALYQLNPGLTWELYKGAPGGEQTLVADDSGPIFAFVAGAINNLGGVAFLAQMDNTLEGIYTGPNPVTDKVIQKGETLFGSQVVALGMWKEGINDNGEVAFTYVLANGVQGVAAAKGEPPPPCAADCDGNTLLNIDDFICFQTLYAIGSPLADCDESETLNIDDFICFQTLYAIGC